MDKITEMVKLDILKGNALLDVDLCDENGEDQFLIQDCIAFIEEMSLKYSDLFPQLVELNENKGNLAKGYDSWHNPVSIVVSVLERLNIDKDEEIDKQKKNSRKCFIVHGHDDNLKLEVARFIEKELDIEAIILHEKASRGNTIIEKFEAHSDVDFAVCLYTADDLGSSEAEKDNLKLRARQNVIFEAGFFMGKLGRENVILIKDEAVEKPSDNDGIVYISTNEEWKEKLRTEVNDIYNEDK